MLREIREVDPGSQPSFEALRLGIERIPSGDKYKELIGKGSILYQFGY